MDPSPPIAVVRAIRPRRRRRSRIVAWLVILVVGITCTAVTYGVLRDRGQAGIGLPAYSVYSDGPDGFAQAADLLRNLGWQPLAVTRPIQQTHHKGLLILAESMNRLASLGQGPSMSEADAEGLLDWVDKGNTLVLCGSINTRLHTKLGVFVSDAAESGDTVTIATPGAVGEYTAGLEHIAVEQSATVSGSKAVPLWWLGNRPAAAAVPYGKGRVLVLADPSVFTHRGLLRVDNAVFLYNVAALDAEEGCVYFDEYHHGIRSGGGYWSYLRYHDQQWIVLHLLAVAVMTQWSVGRRLGPAVPMPVTKRADGVDYASSVARIYEKADVRPLVAGILARNFLEAMRASLRMRRQALPHEMLKTWRQRHGDSAAHELGHLLDAAQALQSAQVPTDAQMVALARRFDQFLASSKVSKVVSRG